MYSIIIYYILLVSLFGISSGKGKKKENVDRTITKWSDDLSNFSNVSIDVQLYRLPTLLSDEEVEEKEDDATSHTGLIEILIPRAPHSMYLCFNQSFEDYQQVYLFAHVTCRQLGFMTFDAVNGKELPPSLNAKFHYGIKPDSYRCTGQEQSISHCKWKHVTTDACQAFTEVSCGACYDTKKAFSGIITSPGFPFANPYDVTCEWIVIVPKEHTILLSLDYFEALRNESLEFPCSVHLPYIEIMYGIQSKVTVHRYCQLSEVKNVSIPFNTMQIRIFTGLYSGNEEFLHEKEKGISISFEAVPVKEMYDSPLKMILLALLGLIFIVCIVLCRYIQKYELCDCCLQEEVATPEEDLEKAREIQICNVAKPRIEKSRLCMHSNEHELKSKRLTSSSTPGIEYNERKGYSELLSPAETSKTSIPKTVLNNCVGGEDKQNISWPAKAKLQHRYSEKEDPNKLSVSSTGFEYPISTCIEVCHQNLE